MGSEARRHKEAMKKKDEQLYQILRQVSDLMNDKTHFCYLALNLLASRRPSLSYPMLLWERYYLFKLKVVFENRPYLGSSTQTFLESFCSRDFNEQSLLCELFLHNIMCEYVNTKMVANVFSYMGVL